MPNPGIDPGRRASAAANAITRLHREHYGRGAVSAHTVIQRDYVIVFLEDIYTPAERTLLEAGELQAVHESRLAFQRAMKTRFIQAVEAATSRTVRAFLSQTHIAPDISCEVFVLEPAGSEPTDSSQR